MKILVVGGGGREHTIVWKILQSKNVEKVYCAPGNGGIREIAECVDIAPTDIKGLVNFARKKKIDLTVVGPEIPLALGIVDEFNKKDLPVFGPDQKGARIESSKVFAKDLMKAFNIPCADSEVFTDPEKAEKYISEHQAPYVLKADGLAAGKGVIICKSRNEAYDGIATIMRDKVFGESGSRLLIEEFLQGEEVSVLAVTDGKEIVVLPPAQDHKAIFENDKGPNTGGMGAYAPAPVIDEKMVQVVKDKILYPVLWGMESRNIIYKGVLYAGLMITSGGPKVLEFNCRFGDPETQAVLPLIESDFVELLLSSVKGTLKDYRLKIRNKSAVNVVIASGGYPGKYEKGKVVFGYKINEPDVMVFHAGTAYKGKDLVTSGGRVISVTAVDNDIKSAVKKAYNNVGKITFDGAYYRKDIAHRALKR
ncbi:phosphoribosylamine--glycine ligase [candidate division KSB1 bacterium]|nr:MAG: phosphoribosylamine--glycine ligase [candidate division KSB1 bacterium]